MNKRGGQFLDRDDLAILTIISALAAVAIDHTRLVEAAKLAEVATLMGDITHDIKNLLMPIVCGAGILQTEIDELLDRPRIIWRRQTDQGQSRTLQRSDCDAKGRRAPDSRSRRGNRGSAGVRKKTHHPLDFSACEVAASSAT